ncbi:alpha/beta fold hydrolase [Cohnella suwonensis]|uniref:Alpha/beta fold hydrolase n=1 Tax=Cohnella suwonensis TaxID=696072 RepID=A0ABW0LRL3_9BACL
MGFLHANGAKFGFESLGSGEPVILLHAHSVDRRMWNPQFEKLAESYEVIRYDLRGYGQSDIPRSGEPFSHAEDLRGIMDELDVPKAHLVGLSLGSFVALDMLAFHSDRVLSVAVASGAIFEGETGAQAKSDPNFKRDLDVPAFKRRWLQSLLADCGPYREEISGDLQRMVADWSAWQPVYETVLPIAGASSVPLLRDADARIPVLVIIGEEDSAGSRRSSAELLGIRPSAREVRLQDAGHMSSMETPDAFLDALLRFWRAVPGE